MILPSHINTDADFSPVGDLIRVETTELVIGYTFDLQTNDMRSQRIANPGAGTQHAFRAWRLKGSPMTPVIMRNIQPINTDANSTNDELESAE